MLDMASEEEADPLRHFMQDLPEYSTRSTTGEILAILPGQSFTVNDGILKLSFFTSGHDHLTIRLVVDASPGCGGVAWPAGQILATYLVHKGPDFLQNKNIIELGSGTGLVGLVAAKMGGRVCITDQAPLLEIMRQNVLMNSLSSNTVVAELNWGSPLPENIFRPTLILAADCVYFEPAFPLLVNTLSDLSDSSTEILFCYKKRRKADKRFFALLRKKFTWKEVADDPNRTIYSREAITLLQVSKI